MMNLQDTSKINYLINFRTRGNWVHLLLALRPQDLWTSVSNLNLQADEIIIKDALTGDLFCHILNHKVIIPSLDEVNKGQYESLQKLISMRLN